MDDSDPPSEQGSSPDGGPSLMRGAVEFLTLGLSAAVAIAIAAGVGYLLDRWWGTSPWFTLIGLALGVAAAVMMAVARVRKYL